MNAQTYHQQLVSLIDAIPALTDSSLSYREIDENECYIKGVLTFASGHELHLAEYIIIQGDSIIREKYRYQLLTADKKQLVHWDNAAHHKAFATFPHHRHDASDIAHPCRPMSPADAIVDSLGIIESQS